MDFIKQSNHRSQNSNQFLTDELNSEIDKIFTSSDEDFTAGIEQKNESHSEYQALREEAKDLLANAPKDSALAALSAQCKAKIDTLQFAAGGETIHRGFYCPNPIIDIIIGNAGRGRLLKTNRSSKITYGYGFCGDKLLSVKKGDEREWIVYRDNRQLGYTYQSLDGGEIKLTAVCECVYNGEKLASYMLARPQFNPKFYDLDKFTFEYENGLLKSAVWYSLSAGHWNHNEYIFEHDFDGYLSRYKAIEFINGEENENFYWKDHWFEVSPKRKI